jgi:hypothetical protein
VHAYHHLVVVRVIIRVSFRSGADLHRMGACVMSIGMAFVLVMMMVLGVLLFVYVLRSEQEMREDTLGSFGFHPRPNHDDLHDDADLPGVDELELWYRLKAEERH